MEYDGGSEFNDYDVVEDLLHWPSDMIESEEKEKLDEKTNVGIGEMDIR